MSFYLQIIDGMYIIYVFLLKQLMETDFKTNAICIQSQVADQDFEKELESNNVCIPVPWPVPWLALLLTSLRQEFLHWVETLDAIIPWHFYGNLLVFETFNHPREKQMPIIDYYMVTVFLFLSK